MRSDKNEAVRLRKIGKSYREIKKQLGVPVSTLSDWLHKIKWSRKLAKKLGEQAKTKSTIRLINLNKIRGNNLKQLYEEAEIEAVKEFENLKLHPLFVAGISIYWGEGDKLSKHIIRVANTDPTMIKLFARFLINICGIDKNKIKLSLLLYPDLNEVECKNFWIKNTKITEKNFNKSIRIEGKHKTKRVRYGVCTVSVCSTYLKKKILKWLKILPVELIKNKNMYLRV